jgi:acetoin utilization protein AcuB
MTHFRHVPPVKAVMTAFPHAIERQDSAQRALDSMREHRVRHLPVKDNHRLVGIISERDLRSVDAAALPHRTVGEFCTDSVYTVDIDTPLDNVLVAMADLHIGAALVVHKDHLAGIFTTTDACRWFATYLHEQFRPGPGSDAA